MFIQQASRKLLTKGTNSLQYSTIKLGIYLHFASVAFPWSFEDTDVTQWSKHLCSTGKSLDFIVITFMGEGTLGQIKLWLTPSGGYLRHLNVSVKVCRVINCHLLQCWCPRKFPITAPNPQLPSILDSGIITMKAALGCSRRHSDPNHVCWLW